MGRQVLLVDDSLTIRTVVKLQLQGMDLSFVEASSGEQGLALAKQNIPSLVIADVCMPGMDGITFCRSVRAISGAFDLPVLLLTGVHDEAVDTEAFRAGAQHCLHKPIDAAELQRMVKNVLHLK